MYLISIYKIQSSEQYSHFPHFLNLKDQVYMKIIISTFHVKGEMENTQIKVKDI